MSDLLQIGSTWLEGMRHTHASSPVTYRRGTEEISLRATLGKTDYEVDDAAGMRVQAEVMDFLIRAADLVLAGNQSLPQVGDQIRVTRGDQLTIFEVLPLVGTGCWRYSDAYGQTMRIHTKEVGTQ